MVDFTASPYQVLNSRLKNKAVIIITPIVGPKEINVNKLLTYYEYMSVYRGYITDCKFSIKIYYIVHLIYNQIFVYEDRHIIYIYIHIETKLKY